MGMTYTDWVENEKPLMIHRTIYQACKNIVDKGEYTLYQEIYDCIYEYVSEHMENYQEDYVDDL